MSSMNILDGETKVKCFSCGKVSTHDNCVPSEHWECWNCDAKVGPDSNERWYHNKVQELKDKVSRIQGAYDSLLENHNKTVVQLNDTREQLTRTEVRCESMESDNANLKAWLREARDYAEKYCRKPGSCECCIGNPNAARGGCYCPPPPPWRKND